jgi:hypothetical protein
VTEKNVVGKEQWDALVYAGLANSYSLGADVAERMDRMEKYK